MSRFTTCTTPKAIRVTIRDGAYAIYRRGEGLALYVNEQYVGTFERLSQCTTEADRLLTEAARLEA